MKTHGILAVAIVLLVVSTMAGQDQPVKNEKLRQELLDRVEKDQAARKSLLEMLPKSKIGDPIETTIKNQNAIKEMMEIDRQNTSWLKWIIWKHGWPGKTLVGQDGGHSAWILVMHANHDRDFQKKCLDLLKVAVKEKEASAQDFAYLTDRLLIAEKKKQIYGTQLTQEGDKLVPQPIEDEEHVDERRKEIGLEPLAEYLKSVEMMLNPKKGE